MGSIAPERTPDEVAAFLFGDPDEAVEAPSPEDTQFPSDDRPTSALRPGAELGRYRLLFELGRGGMGVVYRALDHKLGREVALKVLLVAGRVDKEALDRFQREALAAAAMDHPNIIKVLDVGRLEAGEEGFPFYTMELLQGEDLGFAIARGRITPREAVEVTRQVALALAYAHGRGILHRDVKPHNVFLRASESRPSHAAGGPEAPTIASTKRPSTTTRATIHRKEETIHAFLLDFGLAKLTEHDFASGFGESDGKETVASLTRSGEILGTPVYMPPEQVRSARHLDSRADVYALGATLYHALTGRPPFEQTTLAELLEAVQQADPRSPATVNPQLDADLETLCMKCLAKEPAHRYATAEDLAEDCARYLAGEELVARPVGLLGRLWRKARRNRQVARLAIGLGVAVLALVGLVLHYAVFPALRASAARARAEEEREARLRNAEAELAACRAAVERRDVGSAEAAAKRIIDAYTPYAEREPDLPVAEAHVELARIRSGQGDSREALVEFYRAFERVVGTSRAAPALVRIGEHLWAMEEVERAQGVFARALDERPDEASRFRAQWGLVRCLAGRSEFEEARSMIEGLIGSPHALAGDRESMKRLHGFLCIVTPSVEVPVSLHDYDVGDLDGDGKPELVALSADGRSVVVGRLAGGRFEELNRTTVLDGGAYGLSEVAVLDVDGKAGCEVVVGGGVPGTGPGGGEGTVALLAMEGGSLRVRGRAPIAADLRGRPFAAADLDGDGARELVVGTSWYDRAVLVFRVSAEGLAPGARIEAGGDVWGVVTRDADGDGLPEVWAFVGPWGAYDILCVEYEPARKAFAVRSRTPFGRETTLDAAGRGDSVLAGLLWTEDSLRPLAERQGRARVEERYRAPGAYEVRFRADLTPDPIPIWRLPWPAGRPVGGYATELSGPDGRFAWTSATGLGGAGAGPDEDRGVIRVFSDESGAWTLLAAIRTTSRTYSYARAHDLDGDGDSELVVELPGIEGATGRIGALRVFGLGGVDATVRASPSQAAVSAAQLPPPAGSRALLAAREAERLGLDDEAARKCQEVVDRPETQEDLEEAALGLLRALARLGKVPEAAGAASASASRYPHLRLPLQRALLASADEAGQWSIALAAARDLSTAPGLPQAEARELADRVRRLGQLANPAPVVEVGAESFLACDLLATSPLFAERGDHGLLRVCSGTDTDDGLFVPLTYDGSALRVAADVTPDRHDWETNLEIGLATGEPWAPALLKTRHNVEGRDLPRPSKLICAFFESSGDTYEPIRRWVCTGCLSGARRTDWAHDLEAPPGARSRVVLEYAPHQRIVRCRVTLQEPSKEASGGLTHAFVDDERIFLAVLARGIAGMPGRWGDFRIEGLRLDAGSPNVRRASYAPCRAADLLLLANGRWIQGRTGEARGLYDRAIEAADLESALAAEMTKRGLPSDLEARWAERFVKWVAVDARLWRGLLRASLDDAEGAQEDLDAALARNEGRVARLLLNSALPLRGRRKEAGEVRRCLMRRGGFDERSELREFGEGFLGMPGGADLVASLLLDQGFEVRPGLIVDAVEGEAPLAEGDRILSYDGQGVREFAVFRNAQSAAREAGKRTITVVVLRRGGTHRAEIDPAAVTIRAREGWEIVAKPR
ncbi:MAG: protein kinase [Planctomycetota bacterium]